MQLAQFSRIAGAIPLPLLRKPARLAFHHILARHPALFERMGEYRNKKYAFILADLPFFFVVEPQKPLMEIYRKGETVKTDAEIEGPLITLLSLLEGRLDADALFFARDVIVTGDMEAMLALRNTLDASNIDLPHDLSTIVGPLSPVLKKIAGSIRNYAISEKGTSWN